MKIAEVLQYCFNSPVNSLPLGGGVGKMGFDSCIKEIVPNCQTGFA